MDERYTRITVPLSRAEFDALQTAAQCDLRHPRDQARHLLRSLLLDNERIGHKNNETALALDGTGGLIITSPLA